jgi:hypothetical protein
MVEMQVTEERWDVVDLSRGATSLIWATPFIVLFVVKML